MDEKPRRVKAKITRVVTEMAVVSLDRAGNIDELFETLEEIESDDYELIRIDSVLSYHD